MFPDSPYAPPAGSFGRPIPVFTQDLDGTPSAVFTVPCSYLPYIRGALQQLWLQSTWDTNDPAALLLAQQRAQTLVASLVECPGAALPFSCPYDFILTSAEGWAVIGRGDLSPVPGFYDFFNGFTSDTAQEVSAPDWWQSLTIEKTYATPVSVGIVTFHYNLTLGSNYLGNLHANPSGSILWLGGSVVATDLPAADTLPTGSGQLYSHDYAGVVADKVWFSLLAGVTQFSPADGLANIVDASVQGVGDPGPC